jgi:hypothetical protein
MGEETQSISENFPVSEEVKSKVAAFKESVSKGDGSLIVLRKTTRDGNKLYIAVRHLENPWEYYEKDTAPGYYDIERRIKEGANITAVEPNFYGWEEDSMREGSPDMTGVILVDVYTQTEDKILPLGHMDWWLRDDYANGGGQVHQASKPQSEHEQAASRRWNQYDSTAFKVDYSYHSHGIGSLMLATSAVALPAFGTRKFFTGRLLDSAKKTYARFGIQESDFPYDQNPWNRHLPIERLSENPQVNKVVARA